MSGNDGGVLGDESSLSVGIVTLPKRQVSQVDHLELGESSIISLENGHQHYVSIPSSVSSDNLNLENVLVTNSRISQNANGGSGTSLQHSVGPSNHPTYSTMEYVASPVVGLQEDHKFTEGLAPVSNVDFVEMSDASIKSNTGAPLDLYFDVMPTTSANSTLVPQAASSYLPRHEHQTPKAQLLVRAYSDFIQPQEQQQQQQTHQQQVSVHVHQQEQGPSENHPDTILPDVLEANFVQLEQGVIPHNITEYRKSSKFESQKRHIQMQVQQQKQLQSFTADTLNEQHSDSYNQKIILDQQPLHSHAESLHSHQQIQAQGHLKEQPHFSVVSQQPRYQLIHKQFNQPQRQQINVTEYIVKDDMMHQNMMVQYSNPHKTLQNSLVSEKLPTDNLISSRPKGNSPKSQNESAHILPMVSRSGRPIRRRPEYIDYVNQNFKDEQQLHSNSNDVSMVKIEGTYVEDDDNDVVEDEENSISNDDDQDQSGTYSSDGKKSLPHKKRIPKKLKNTKKHIKCYKCGQCGEQFINQANFTQHKQSHIISPIKPKQFLCEICSKGCDSQLKFFEHLKSHYEPFKKHKCEVCGGEFGSVELLHEHSLIHSREHFKCNVCHKTFRKESMLENHMKVVHLEEENNSAEKHYTCTVCPKSYRSQIALDTHVQTEHSDNLPELNCEDCYRVFKSKSKLLSHRKVEHKEEINNIKAAPKKKIRIAKSTKGGYACSYCPKSFPHKNSLIYHVRSHTGERPHQCDQCGKAFFAASALKVHLRLHSGEKPYKCGSCEKYFRQWGDLRYHTSSVHSDARDFQCEYCGKDFKRKYCLVVHRRIHTGEKKYKCEYCQKSFRASSYLQNHIRIHTGERPYPCPDCGKPFRVRSDMKRHRNTHMREAGNRVSANSPSGAPSSTHTTAASTVATIQSSNPPSSIITSQAHTIIARPTSHAQGQQVQILQGPVTGQLGQLIIADGMPAVIGGDHNQPIRIMVSGLNQQSVNAGIQPPPAHRHSQVTTVSLGSSIAPSSPAVASNLTTSANTMASEVIIMDESNSQPINLNILPRMIAQSAAPQTHHSGVPDEEEEYELIPAIPTSRSLEMREEGEVCVWSGINVFTS